MSPSTQHCSGPQRTTSFESSCSRLGNISSIVGLYARDFAFESWGNRGNPDQRYPGVDLLNEGRRNNKHKAKLEQR